MRVEAVLTPAEIATLAERPLDGCVCVVFDVLRATSTFLTALHHGAACIHPVATIEEAFALRDALGGKALLGGERHGKRIEGFDLGNSPLEYTSERVAEREIVSTTTNGTLALRACMEASRVYAGALLNLDALATRLRRDADAIPRLLLVCAGSGSFLALEDALAAAALLERLSPNVTGMDDAALLLQGWYRACADPPLEILRASSNGRRLQEIGLGSDLDWCGQVAVLDTVAYLQGGKLVAESAV